MEAALSLPGWGLSPPPGEGEICSLAFSAGCQLSKEHTLLREGNVTHLASQSMSSLPDQADEPSTAGGRSQLSAEGKLGYMGGWGWGGGETFATIQHSGMRNATSISPNKMQPASSFRRSGPAESPFQSQPGPLGSSCEGPELGVSGGAVHLGRGQRVLSGVLTTLLFSL